MLFVAAIAIKRTHPKKYVFLSSSNKKKKGEKRNLFYSGATLSYMYVIRHLVKDDYSKGYYDCYKV